LVKEAAFRHRSGIERGWTILPKAGPFAKPHSHCACVSLSGILERELESAKIELTLKNDFNLLVLTTDFDLNG
jgi:hypothetical protein